MGQSKGNGYNQVPTMTGDQTAFSQQALQQALPWLQQSAQGFQQFLPGGGGGQPIIDQAMQRYKQQTIPAITNAFGSDSKSSSALNQALASSASGLNTDLASMLSQMQLQASGGLGNLGQSVGQFGGKDRFAFLRQQPPQWEQLLKAAIGGATGAGAGALTGGVPGAIFGGIGGASQGFGG